MQRLEILWRARHEVDIRGADSTAADIRRAAGAACRDAAHRAIQRYMEERALMGYLELAQAYAKACRERDMALAQLADIGAGYAEKMDDFVRVVRCKDCVWSGSNTVGNLCGCAINLRLVKLNGYCSQGKRRADNG